MATKKITDLTNITSVQDTDLLIVETSNGTKSVKKSDLVSSVVGSIPTKLSQLTDDSTHRLVTDSEKSTWNNKVDGGHTHLNGLISPAAIEFNTSASSNHGGYIDFHWNGSAADYTSRIIENTSGSLYLEASVGVKNSALGISCVRNIHAGNYDLTAGSTPLTTGTIYLMYE